jgi:hypothetical protein
MEGTHPTVPGGLRILGLLFAGDLPMASSTSYGLQKKIELVDKYCKNLNLRCNLNKSKIMILQEEEN